VTNAKKESPTVRACDGRRRTRDGWRPSSRGSAVPVATRSNWNILIDPWAIDRGMYVTVSPTAPGRTFEISPTGKRVRR